MKTFKDYIYENKLFEEQCDKYLIDINSNNHKYYEIDEGVIDWFKNLFKKTGSFLEKWFKRGGKKVQATENSGTFKITNRTTSQNIKDLKNDFEKAGYSKIFTNTYNYLNNYNKYIIDNIDSSIFEKTNATTILFEPKYAFTDEKYPVSIILYSDKIQLIDGKNGIHIFNFDMANIITGVNENQMFKIFIDKIAENKNLSYISYSVKDNIIPPKIKKIRYKGEIFKQYNPQYAIMTLINNK